jgi:hypothetical protein
MGKGLYRYLASSEEGEAVHMSYVLPDLCGVGGTGRFGGGILSLLLHTPLVRHHGA